MILVGPSPQQRRHNFRVPLLGCEVYWVELFSLCHKAAAATGLLRFVHILKLVHLEELFHPQNLPLLLGLSLEAALCWHWVCLIWFLHSWHRHIGIPFGNHGPKKVEDHQGPIHQLRPGGPREAHTLCVA